MSMKILVTGGAGFLGSHMCDLLLKQGHEVYCLDNYFTGTLDNIQDAIRNGGDRFHYATHDVINPLDAAKVTELFGSDIKFDRVYCMACPASPPHYQKDPVFTLKTSVWGTLHALELCERTGARFFITSTSEVYGDPEVHPQVESYRGNTSCTGIRACYDEGKRCAETLAFDFMRSRGVEVRVARIFNTYGPRMDPNDGRIISNFVVQAIKGEALTMYGDGSQTRSFCFYADLIEGLNKLCESDFPGPCNVGNPEEHTIAEMGDLIREFAGSASSIISLPLPSDDPKIRRPDISLARAKIGWEGPKVALRDGLLATIDYFRGKLQRDAAKAAAAAAGEKAGMEAGAGAAAADAPSSSGLCC